MKNMRILAIGYEPLDIDFLSTKLRVIKIQAKITSCFLSEAAELLTSELFDFVLSDPISISRLIEDIKRGINKDKPLIAWTKRALIDDKRMALSNGFDYYFAMPDDNNGFFNLLRSRSA